MEEKALPNTLKALAVMAVLLGTSAQAAGPSPAEIFEKASFSVMVVRGLNENESPIRQGSGVIISAKTVVTNCHVIAKAKQVQVRQGGISYQAQLEHADIERDLCQLNVPDLRLPSSPVAISPQPLKVGQRVFTIGSPNGREFAMSDGLVYGIGMSSDGNVPPIEVTTTVPQGVSGGGMFDEAGKLVGIASATAANTSVRGHGLATPSAWIAEIPVRAKIRKAATEQAQAQAQTQGSKAAVAPPTAKKLGTDEIRKAMQRSSPFKIGKDGWDIKFDSGGWWAIDSGPAGFPRRGYSSITADGQVCLVQTVPALAQGMRYSGCYDAQMADSGPAIELIERERKQNP